MPRNKLILIGILGSLLLIKFVFLPLSEMQQDLHQQLTVLNKQLQRSKALLEEQSVLQEWQESQSSRLESLLQPLPEVSSASQYRLSLQQEIQQLAAEKQVSVTFFDWLTDLPLDAFNVHRGKVSLRVEGRASQVMQLHVELEKRFLHFSIRDIRASWRGALDQERRIELNFLIDVDYKLPEAA